MNLESFQVYKKKWERYISIYVKKRYIAYERRETELDPGFLKSIITIVSINHDIFVVRNTIKYFSFIVKKNYSMFLFCY